MAKHRSAMAPKAYCGYRPASIERHRSLQARAFGRAIRRWICRMPASIDTVFSPGPGEVLDAGDLGPGHPPGRREAPDPVAVGVAGEVADQAGATGHHVDEGRRVGRVDPEIGQGLLSGRRVEGVVVPEDQHRPVGPGPELVEPIQLIGADLTRGRTQHRGVEQRQRHPGKGDFDSAPWLRATCRGCRASSAAGRRRRPGSSRRNASYSRWVPPEVRSPLATTAAGPSAEISSTAARFITSGYGSSPGSELRTGPMSRPSIRPHSVSPKWRSLTVATTVSRGPSGRGRVRKAMPSCS